MPSLVCVPHRSQTQNGAPCLTTCRCSERNGTRATQWHALRLPTTKLVAQSDVYT